MLHLAKRKFDRLNTACTSYCVWYSRGASRMGVPLLTALYWFLISLFLLIDCSRCSNIVKLMYLFCWGLLVNVAMMYCTGDNYLLSPVLVIVILVPPSSRFWLHPISSAVLSFPVTNRVAPFGIHITRRKGFVMKISLWKTLCYLYTWYSAVRNISCVVFVLMPARAWS